MSTAARSIGDLTYEELSAYNPVSLYVALDSGQLTEDGWLEDDDYSRKKGLLDQKVGEGRMAFRFYTSHVFAKALAPERKDETAESIRRGLLARTEYDRLVAREAAMQRMRDEAFEAEVASEPTREWVRRGDDVLTTTEIPFVVRGRIHQVGIGQLAAQPYQGKTLVGIDLALSVANGLDAWMGYPIENPGPVVYVAGEGGAAIQVHIDAWLKDNPGCTLDDFVLVDEMPIDWTVPSSVARLDRLVRKVFTDDEAPVLVIGDTQVDLVGMVDENAIAMGHVFREMRRWAVDNDLFFLLMHHMGHAGGRGRGHSSQFAKADVLATLEAESDTVKKLKWAKVKGCAKPSRGEVLQIRSVPDSTGAVIEPKPAMSAVAAEAGRLAAMERSIIEAVRHNEAAKMKRISKNAIRTATHDDGKIVTGAQVTVNAKIDDMVRKGLLTYDGVTYGVGVVPD